MIEALPRQRVLNFLGAFYGGDSRETAMIDFRTDAGRCTRIPLNLFAGRPVRYVSPLPIDPAAVRLTMDLEKRAGSGKDGEWVQ